MTCRKSSAVTALILMAPLLAWAGERLPELTPAPISRSEVPFERRVAFAAKPAERPRRVDRTWIFAERQLYGGHQNMLHIWADRPLFHDAGLRDEAMGGLDAAFLKDVDVLRRVGLDGFASLDHYPVHLRQLKRLGELKSPIAGYSQMIVIPGYATERDYPKIKNMILTAAKSPYTTRLDGKLVFWRYGWGEQGRHEWWAKRLRSDAEIPPFLFIGDMPLIDIYHAWNKHEWKGERTPESEVAAFRKMVEDAIAVMDGFQVRCTEYYWDYNGGYEHRSEKAGFYRDYLLPIAQEIFARPENRGKLIGTYVRQGYTNKFTGVVDGQFGTETLRNYLDEILFLNPDVIMCFEWNEAEENTHFQPTVANGTTYARVLAHYRALLDRRPFAPQPGDDTRIPNFVVSVRQALRLGETYRVELLYLPDGTAPQTIKAQMCVKDEDGRVLAKLPQETFATDRLTAVTYEMPSERFPDAQTLRIELRTDVDGDRRTWTAFDATLVDATRCKNYLYTHHPLREQMDVVDSSFTVRTNANATSIAAALVANEPLASFEILDGNEEVAAADCENRFDRRRFAVFRGMLSAMDTGKLGWTNGTISVVGATNAMFSSGHYPWEGFRLGANVADGTWKVDCNLGSDRSNFFVCVPHGNLADAVLDLDLKDAAAFRVPLASIGAPKDHLLVNVARNVPGAGAARLVPTSDYQAGSKLVVRWAKGAPAIQMLPLGQPLNGVWSTGVRLAAAEAGMKYDVSLALNTKYKPEVEGVRVAEKTGALGRGDALRLDYSSLSRNYFGYTVRVSDGNGKVWLERSLIARRGRQSTAIPMTGEHDLGDIATAVVHYYPGQDRARVTVFPAAGRRLEGARVVCGDCAAEAKAVGDGSFSALVETVRTSGAFSLDGARGRA